MTSNRTIAVILASLALFNMGMTKPMASRLKLHRPKPPKLPVYIEGTVAEYAVLSAVGNLPVQGYGVVVGLGVNGSRDVPPSIKKYLVDYLNKHKTK